MNKQIREDGTRIKRADRHSGGERKPEKSSRFRQYEFNASAMNANTINGSMWRRGDIAALSTLELADAPDESGDMIPQWHLSISHNAGIDRRPNDLEVRQTLACFGMSESDEDNHESGILRHFWMPVDPARRAPCPCKSETVVTEPDGHQWSTPADATQGCNGCDYVKEMASIGIARTCTIHDKGRVLSSTGDVLLTMKEGWGPSVLMPALVAAAKMNRLAVVEKNEQPPAPPIVAPTSEQIREDLATMVEIDLREWDQRQCPRNTFCVHEVQCRGTFR